MGKNGNGKSKDQQDKGNHPPAVADDYHFEGESPKQTDRSRSPRDKNTGISVASETNITSEISKFEGQNLEGKLTMLFHKVMSIDTAQHTNNKSVEVLNQKLETQDAKIDKVQTDLGGKIEKMDAEIASMKARMDKPPPSPPGLGRWGPPPPGRPDAREEKSRRTVVVTGFPRDTRRVDIVAKLREVLSEVTEQLDGEPYTLNKRASLGFARFRNETDRREFLAKAREADRPTYEDKDLHVGPERPLADRLRARPLSAVARTLTEKGIDKSKVEIDFRTGALWVDGATGRLCEWTGRGDSAKFRINREVVGSVPDSASNLADILEEAAAAAQQQRL